MQEYKSTLGNQNCIVQDKDDRNMVSLGGVGLYKVVSQIRAKDFQSFQNSNLQNEFV